MGLSFWQIAIVVILFLLLFGRGKLPALMSDLAEGISNFRKGLSNEGGGEAAASAEKIERREAAEASTHERA